MKILNGYKILAIISLFLLTYLYLFYSYNNKIKNINTKARNQILNKNAFPVIENNDKYIEDQTKIWIEKRNKNLPCYGMLEKDKIIMASWMTKLNIRSPKIHYYDYHDNFNLDKFSQILTNNKQRLVIKISHLQSNYGIILVKSGEKNDKYIKYLYKKILHKFNSCFVCNHDDNKAPNNKQIKNGEKKSYYKLYETVKPGIIIQDYFDSHGNNKENKPIEFKILLFGGYIINIKKEGGMPIIFSIDSDKYKKVMEFVRDISEKLGSILIRIDIFVKSSDNPYIPYLNEISLSPNGGMKNFFLLSKNLLDKYKKDVKNRKGSDMEEIDNLYKDAPKRTIPIEYYLSDADSKKKDKFSF